ncbi:hypothetical protein LX36DRAFT_109384 [Colletotrichum falcatum]|nr:hypothetical protein LX36DRAFT_109384 [Colletotrichum falcatum]
MEALGVDCVRSLLTRPHASQRNAWGIIGKVIYPASSPNVTPSLLRTGLFLPFFFLFLFFLSFCSLLNRFFFDLGLLPAASLASGSSCAFALDRRQPYLACHARTSVRFCRPTGQHLDLVRVRRHRTSVSAQSRDSPSFQKPPNDPKPEEPVPSLASAAKPVSENRSAHMGPEKTGGGRQAGEDKHSQHDSLPGPRYEYIRILRTCSR